MTSAPMLHIVSGKGGTGKSTMACALAIALAEAGKRVLLVETEGRQSLAALLGLPSLGYTETRVDGPWNGALWAQSIEPAPALADYVGMFFPLPGAGSVLQRSGATTFVTALAPGLRDVLITGKFCEAARRRRGPQYQFDAVVVDAPPTGRVHTFLNVTNAVSLVSPPGTVRAHAERIRDIIGHPRTQVHLVVNDDAAAVSETGEAVALLQALGIHIGVLVHNRAPVAWPRLPEGPRVEHLLHAAGADGGSVMLAQALLRAAEQSAERMAASDAAIAPLRTGAYPVVEVPDTTAATVTDMPRRLARLIDLDIFGASA